MRGLSRFFLVLIIVSLVFTFYNFGVPTVEASPDTQEWQVGASTDDCHKYDTTLQIDHANVYVQLASYDTEFGVRFTNITIPQGSTITSAYLIFYARVLGDAGGTVTIKGEDHANASTFSDLTDFDGRIRTSQNYNWTLAKWESGTWYGKVNNPNDVSNIIEAIVGNSSWSSGNSIVLFGKETNSDPNHGGESWDHASTDPPKLEVTWSEAADETEPEWDTGNLSPDNGTSVDEMGNVTLTCRGQDETALDYAWLETNETGSMKNYTTIFTELWSENYSWVRARNSYVVDDIWYIVDQDELHTFNVSDKSNPISLDNETIGASKGGTGDGLLDIQIDVEGGNTWAYINDVDVNRDCLFVVNVTDPSNCAYYSNVTHSTYLDRVHGIRFKEESDGTAYVYCCAYSAGAGGGGYFTIVNVTNRASPTICGNITDSPNDKFKGCHDVYVKDVGTFTYAYIGTHYALTGSQGSFTIVNVTDKTSPVVTDSVNHTDLYLAGDVELKDDYAFVGGRPSQGGKLVCYDVSNVSDIQVADTLSGVGFYRGSVLGNTLYGQYDFPSGNDDVWAVDITNCSDLLLKKQLDIDPYFSMDAFESGGYLYVSRRVSHTATGTPTIYALSHESPLDMRDAVATWTWSNFTWSNSSISATTQIQWRIWYNDTSGNLNKTDIRYFTITGAVTQNFSGIVNSQPSVSDVLSSSFGRFASISTQLTVASIETFTMNPLGAVALALAIISLLGISLAKSASVNPTLGIGFQKSVSFSLLSSINGLFAISGQFIGSAIKSFFGSIVQLLNVDSKRTWTLGLLSAITQSVTIISSTEFISAQIKNFYGTINHQVTLTMQTVWDFSKFGSIAETLSVTLRRTLSFDQLASVSPQFSVSHSSTFAFGLLSSIVLAFTLVAQKTVSFELLSLISPLLALTSQNLMAFSTSGTILQQVAVNLTKTLSFDLLSSINQLFTIAHRNTWAFSLLSSINQSFTVVGQFFTGAIKDFYGTITQQLAITITKTFSTTISSVLTQIFTITSQKLMALTILSSISQQYLINSIRTIAFNALSFVNLVSGIIHSKTWGFSLLPNINPVFAVSSQFVSQVIQNLYGTISQSFTVAGQYISGTIKDLFGTIVQQFAVTSQTVWSFSLFAIIVEAFTLTSKSLLDFTLLSSVTTQFIVNSVETMSLTLLSAINQIASVTHITTTAFTLLSTITLTFTVSGQYISGAIQNFYGAIVSQFTASPTQAWSLTRYASLAYQLLIIHTKEASLTLLSSVTQQVTIALQKALGFDITSTINQILNIESRTAWILNVLSHIPTSFVVTGQFLTGTIKYFYGSITQVFNVVLKKMVEFNLYSSLSQILNVDSLKSFAFTWLSTINQAFTVISTFVVARMLTFLGAIAQTVSVATTKAVTFALSSVINQLIAVTGLIQIPGYLDLFSIIGFIINMTQTTNFVSPAVTGIGIAVIALVLALFAVIMVLARRRRQQPAL